MRSILLAYLCLAACGDDGNRHIVDAPPAPDSPAPIDGAQTPVTVTVTRDGAPVVGVPVYFQNADSSVAGMPMTDTTGTASAVVAAGGTVTVVNTMAPQPGFIPGYVELTTWLGVKPGDHLLLSGGFPASVGMDITVPADVNHGTIGSYSLYTSCSSNSPNSPTTQGVATGSGAPTSLVFTGVSLRGCNGTADFLVVANDVNNEPVSSFFLPAQTVTDAGALDFSAQANNYAVASPHMYHVTGFAGAQLTITDWVASTRGVVFGHDLHVTGDPIDTVANLPSWTNALRFLELFEPTTSYTDHHYIEWGNLDPYSTDYTAHTLPDFTAAPMLDPTTHVVSWTQTGGSTQPDFAVTSLFASRGAQLWTWSVVGPGATSQQLPALPTDVFDFNITATDSVSVNTLSTGKAPGGYDGVRASVFAASGPQSFVIGASGSLISNVYSPILTFSRKGPLRRGWLAPRAR